MPEEKPITDPQPAPPARPSRVPVSRWLSSPAATTVFPRRESER